MAKQKSVPVETKITDTAKEIQSKILKNKSPVMVTPIRSLSNVKYQAKTGYFEMLGKNKIRTLTVSTVKTFAQSLKMMALSKELIDTNDMATKREAYYISKNWGKAGFSEQTESDTIMDDVEAMFGVNREQLKFTPEEKGGDIAGKLIVIDSKLESLKNEKSHSWGLLTSIEAAKALQITTRHLQNLRDRGDIGFVQYGRVVRYKPEDIQAYIDEYYIRSRNLGRTAL